MLNSAARKVITDLVAELRADNHRFTLDIRNCIRSKTQRTTLTALACCPLAVKYGSESNSGAVSDAVKTGDMDLDTARLIAHGADNYVVDPEAAEARSILMGLVQ